MSTPNTYLVNGWTIDDGVEAELIVEACSEQEARKAFEREHEGGTAVEVFCLDDDPK